MKKVRGISILILLVTNYFASAQHDNVVKIDTKIDEVTVFLSGAEIKFSQDIKLRKG